MVLNFFLCPLATSGAQEIKTGGQMLGRLKNVAQQFKQNLADAPKRYNLKNRPIVAIDDIDIKYPLRIVGTRKPGSKYFWAWDFNATPFLIREKLNPYLYLTFQDSGGKIIGPVRYHSELIGWGAKFEISLRSQFGRLNGTEEIELNEFPKKIEIDGSDTTIPTGGFVALHYSKLTFKNSFSTYENLKLNYFGVSMVGGIGHSKIKNGLFEAEEKTTTMGLPPTAEKIGTVFALLSFFGALAVPIFIISQAASLV